MASEERRDCEMEECTWWDVSRRGRTPGEHIFCNRSLKMKDIVFVGFDMDYTLAQYKPETFESLAYEGTIKKLVDDLEYPPELLEWSFDWKYMERGLVLDKKRGNILKMDQHNYVKVAYHGFEKMSKKDKVGTYGNTLIRKSFHEPEYALIDSFFSLAEAYLFSQLVDFVDNNRGKVPNGSDYAQMYQDVRAAVDLCHRDGNLKQEVARDPEMYVNDDTSIVPMLKMLKDSGRSTFLLTNSLWDYTNAVMNFLCRSHTVNDSNSNFDWLKYFDVVITGSATPSFFREDNSAKIFELEPESGTLLKTDRGNPLPQVGKASPGLSSMALGKSTCKVFQGGSVRHLHKLLSIDSSSQVLYVGGHMYEDIFHSKKTRGWRTMLVVPELGRQVEILRDSMHTQKELQSMRTEIDSREEKSQYSKGCLKSEKKKNVDESPKRPKFPPQLSQPSSCELEKEKAQSKHHEKQQEYHQKLHKVWGHLMQTGNQNSHFAHQVERYACLYTSHVSNLTLYSLDNCYDPSDDIVPHEETVL